MSFVHTAQENWGADLPDWLLRLAEEADATSQNKAAKKIGYTGSALSSLFRRRYNADTRAIEEQVRGVLMKATVSCPILGEIGSHDCRSWREKAKRFSSHNSLSVQMFRACTRCPLNKGGDHARTEG